MKILRLGICTLVAFGVAAHGGDEEWARAVFETGAGLLFLFWAVQIFLQRDAAFPVSIPSLLPPLAAFAVVILCQILFRTSASAFNTRAEFQLLLADVLILFLAAQAFRTLEDWRFFVWFMMVFGFLVAIFGILQHLTFNGKLYWFRAMRYGGIPFGPYVNRNHFAGFSELVIPLSLVPLLLGKVRRERTLVVGVFAVVSIVALFLSASRGGIISFAVEVAIAVLWVVLRRTGGKQMLAGGAVLAAAMLLVSWIGVTEILKRFSTMQTMEVSTGKRASMRRDTWKIFTDNLWMGTGLGTLQIVYPPYETNYDGRVVNHTHNDYLEALAETGLAGGICCAAFLVMLFGHALRQLSPLNPAFSRVLHLSALIACLGFLVHSLVDFNLRLPANALLFFLMAHLAASNILQDQNTSPAPRQAGKH